MGLGEIAYGETGVRTGGSLAWSRGEEAELAKDMGGVAREVRGQPEAGVLAAKGGSGQYSGMLL